MSHRHSGIRRDIRDALKVAARQLEESDKELAKVVEDLEQISYERRQYEAELIRLRRKGTLIL